MAIKNPVVLYGAKLKELEPGDVLVTNSGSVTAQQVDVQITTKINSLNNFSFTFTQGVPSAFWTINHNLGYKPGGVLVLDSSNREVIGDINYTDNNNLTISFTGGFSGTAYLS